MSRVGRRDRRPYEGSERGQGARPRSWSAWKKKSDAPGGRGRKTGPNIQNCYARVAQVFFKPVRLNEYFVVINHQTTPSPQVYAGAPHSSCCLCAREGPSFAAG